MSEIITVGLDLAKNVFQVHGADAAGGAVLRKKLRRTQVLGFFEALPPCVVAMEACGGAHYWGREIGKLGHEVRRDRQVVSRDRKWGCATFCHAAMVFAQSFQRSNAATRL